VAVIIKVKTGFQLFIDMPKKCFTAALPYLLGIKPKVVVIEVNRESISLIFLKDPFSHP
jgi:hypothetical protein